MPPISYNGRRALAHLKTIKPAGGWAIDMNKDTKEYRLLKRGGIPLTQRYFKDIHHDVVTGNVVGIVTKGPPTKGQVLVDDQGSPLPRSQLAIIKVATWTNTAKVRPKRNADRERRVGRIENYSLSEEHGHRLIKVAIYIVGASIAIKALMNVFEALYIFLIPLIFLIALVTVPSETDFDVKSEVKQALLRRHQFHDQGLEISDKDWIADRMKLIQSSETDYLVTMTNFAGTARLAYVKVPSVNRSFYWIGVFWKWRYVVSFELETSVLSDSRSRVQSKRQQP